MIAATGILLLGVAIFTATGSYAIWRASKSDGLDASFGVIFSFLFVFMLVIAAAKAAGWSP